MFELFFCPQHGIPAILWTVAPFAGGLYTETQLWYIRFMERFGRYL